MSGWQEAITDGQWSLTITNTYITTGTSGNTTSFEGQGKRTFVETPTGTDSLPADGSYFIDEASSNTYTGIILSDITYVRSHSACGTGNGRTAVANYNSKAEESEWDRDTYGVYEGGLKTITVEGAGDWAWYKDNTSTGTTINVASCAGRVSQALTFVMPSGSFNVKAIINTDSSYSDFISTSNTHLGKINSTGFNGFPIGSVLYNSFSAQKIIVDTMPRWEVTMEFLWRVIPVIDHDAWNFMPNGQFVNNVSGVSWSRPVTVERSDGAGIQSANSFMYQYSNLKKFIQDWTDDDDAILPDPT